MLADRIIQTLKFFDLQDFPLTALEIHRYLIADKSSLRKRLDDDFELQTIDDPPASVHLDTVLLQLSVLAGSGQISQINGFYTLPAREQLATKRLQSYLHGLRRERLIRRYVWFTKYLPFVRGIGLGGSQPLGLQKPTSDIDLLIITERRFIWLARTALTIYFQLFGVRRYGSKIANRFCLNHYLAEPGKLEAGHNLYAAMEYSRLLGLIQPVVIAEFQKQNHFWLKIYFPNLLLASPHVYRQPILQRALESLFNNRFGYKIEEMLSQWQKARIKTDRFVFTKSGELSFHPNSKQSQILLNFFGK